MSNQTRLQIRRKGDETRAYVLVRNNPVDGEDGSASGAAYIDRMTFTVNGRLLAEAHLGPDIAANPLTGIQLAETQPGDALKVRWTDSAGHSGEAETVLAR